MTPRKGRNETPSKTSHLKEQHSIHPIGAKYEIDFSGFLIIPMETDTAQK